MKREKGIWVSERPAGRKETGRDPAVGRASAQLHSPGRCIAHHPAAVDSQAALQLLPCESISKATNKKVTRSVR